MSNPLDTQIGGDHYKRMKIQPIEFILANEIGFCAGNVIKYVSRAPATGNVEDLRKARHYLDIMIAEAVKLERRAEQDVKP